MADNPRPLLIPIPKAGKDVYKEIDPNWVMNLKSEDALREVLLQGLKVVLNRGQSKFKAVRNMTPGKGADDEQELILECVDKQIEALKEGKIKVTGGKSKAAGSRSPERVIAMQLARTAVKDELKRRNMKPSRYAASEISKMAEQLLASGSDFANQILEEAKEEAAKREDRKKLDIGIDVSGMIEDEKAVQRAEAKKTKVAPEVAANVVRGVSATRRPEVRH